MSYHVTILRSSQGKQVPIALQEVQAAVMSAPGWSFADSPPTFSVKRDDRTASLWYSDGELWTKNPEAWTVECMIQLAEALGARVRGDEFETYRSPEETYKHPDDRALKKEAEAASRNSLEEYSRQERRIRYGIYGFFVLLAVVATVIARSCEQQ